MSTITVVIAPGPASMGMPRGVNPKSSLVPPAGAQKVLGWFGGFGWNGTMRFFTQTLHIPAPLAVAAFLVEFLGGLALLAGVYTRWVALLAAAQMVVAAILVHLPNGFFLNWTNVPNKGHGIEYNLLLIGAALALAIIGGGRLSVDGALRK